MKFVAKHKIRVKGEEKEQTISSISLAGKEYKADGDTVEVPDDHEAAIKAAAVVGLEHASADEAPAKRAGKAI